MTGLHSFLLMTALAGIIALSPAGTAAAADAAQSPVTPSQKKETSTPLVLIYTLTTCPHCAEAKAYLTKQGIPFTNREVDMDDEHMAELMRIYDEMNGPDERRGVPFFVIGGKTRLQGFDREKLEAAIKDAAQK